MNLGDRCEVIASDEFNEQHKSEELTRWFIRRLDELEVNVDDEELSYDCNSAYDFLFFRLQCDAQNYAERHLGFVPTPGQLSRSFFGAEYERSRRDRLAKRSWVLKFGDFVGRHWRIAR